MSNIISIVLLLASLGLFTVYVNPLYSKDTGEDAFQKKSVKELRHDLAEYNEALEKTKQIEKVHGGLLSKYQTISEEDLTQINKLLPDHVDTVRLIIDINAIAAKNNMTLRNINIRDTFSDAKESGSVAPTIGPDLSKYETISLSFSIAGSYENFVAFLHDLEESLRIVDVSSVSFTTSSEGNYKYDVSINTYRLK